jgi:hypothetical protein
MEAGSPTTTWCNNPGTELSADLSAWPQRAVTVLGYQHDGGWMSVCRAEIFPFKYIVCSTLYILLKSGMCSCDHAKSLHTQYSLLLASNNWTQTISVTFLCSIWDFESWTCILKNINVSKMNRRPPVTILFSQKELVGKPVSDEWRRLVEISAWDFAEQLISTHHLL